MGGQCSPFAVDDLADVDHMRETSSDTEAETAASGRLEHCSASVSSVRGRQWVRERPLIPEPHGEQEAVDRQAPLARGAVYDSKRCAVIGVRLERMWRNNLRWMQIRDEADQFASRQLLVVRQAPVRMVQEVQIGFVNSQRGRG